VGYLEDAGKQAWTSAANAVCVNVTKSTNCRDGSSGASVAYANSLKGWASADSALCTTDAAKCRDGTGVMVAFGTKAGTGAHDGTCKAVGTSECRDPSSKLTVSTAVNKNKKSTADSECEALANPWAVKKCGNSTTKILEDIGNNYWNSPSGPDVTCKAVTANQCRKTAADMGVQEAVVFTPTGFKGRKSANDAECTDPSTGCMTAITGVIIPFDATPTFQTWNAADNKTCKALDTDKCRHTNKHAQTALNTDGTQIRTSATDATCQGAQTDKCIKILANTSNNSKYWDAFATTSPFNAMNASGNKSCKDLTTSECRDGSSP
jgi:hypothetical protein